MSSVRMHLMVSATAIAALCTLGLAGCGGSKLLLEKEAVGRIVSSPDNEHHIIYYDKTFSYTADGRLLVTTYAILRAGENAAALPGDIDLSDDSGERLIDCAARVTHIDGSTERFSKDDFSNFNVSNRRVIADRYVRSATIENRLAPGDLIESVVVHEQTMAAMGIDFSLSELGRPAENITCSIELQPGDSLFWKIANDNVLPAIHDSTAGKKYTFRWRSYVPERHPPGEMEKRNRTPHLFAARLPQTWQSFGNWYLGLIAPKLVPGPAVAEAARKITAGKVSAREKMDAIFEYCQHNVRYEQMYLSNGELVPNAVDAILERKFGDCKDYASLMYAMARCVGVESRLALCFRGRGKEFFDDAPVSQFNHCMLSFADSGRTFWYDGTNRAGIPGVPSFDLANARALVLDDKNSRIATIEESPGNLLAISGKLEPRGGGLAGTLTVTFSHQYAIDFFWLENQTNELNMTSALALILKKMLNEALLIDSVRWKKEIGAFSVIASCEVPNCVTTLQQQCYLSLGRLFPSLTPRPPKEREKVFYYPSYNNVSIELRLGQNNSPLSLHYHLPAGPFNAESRGKFLEQWDAVAASMSETHKLLQMGNP